MKNFLRQISAIRLEQMSKDLGLEARSPKVFVIDAIANYCAGYRISSADLMARWPDLSNEKIKISGRKRRDFKLTAVVAERTYSRLTTDYSGALSERIANAVLDLFDQRGVTHIDIIQMDK